jgi:phosphatidylserine/phosphatidylglycerophosphate/cardiolipin synthase-like enzyme
VADRAAVLIDMAAYFDAAEIVMRSARRSIHLLNWSFEPDTLMHPQPGCDGPESDRIANILIELARQPGLDVRLLCWDSPLPVASTQHFFPLADRKAFRGTQVKFRLDDKLPVGAAHHQKMIVVDDALAFCGGGDIGPDRWDTPEHLDDNPRREKTRYDHRDYDSRHEVMALVDGEPAHSLGELFRDRWARATGERLPEPERDEPAPPWPVSVRPAFSRVQVGLSRTSARWRAYPQIRECEALHLDAIAGARSCIYMENQYFTSPVIAQALAARLAEPGGPDVVLISTQHSPSYFDQMTMDKTRSDFIRQLKSADVHQRFAIYSPVTTLGRTIIVHAKLTIIDDVLLRVGSANINNRSMGFDTECDLSIEGGDEENRAEISAFRTRLLAHWLGCDDAAVTTAIERTGGLKAGLEALRLSGYCRIRPIEPIALRPLARFIADYHLGDPAGPDDSWRPWARRRALEDRPDSSGPA